MLKKIQTVNSHSGLARVLARLEPTGQYLERAQVAHIPSPYHYSPTIEINRHLFDGKEVVWFETRHRHYEFYEVPATMPRVNTP